MSEAVRFLCDPKLEDRLLRPEPAGRFAPDWFRKMARTMDMPMADGLPGLTVKACLPVTDAFSAGWIIPLSSDLHVEAHPDGSVNTGDDGSLGFQPVTAHHPGQVGAPNPPFGNAILPLKWMNPWRIAAPKGVSLMYTQPFNHFELPFVNFTGIVDADRFGAKVNAPFIWTGGPGRFTLPKGLPLIQIIPLSREALSLNFEVRAATPEEAVEEANHTREKHTVESVYARKYRVAK